MDAKHSITMIGNHVACRIYYDTASVSGPAAKRFLFFFERNSLCRIVCSKNYVNCQVGDSFHHGEKHDTAFLSERILAKPQRMNIMRVNHNGIDVTLSRSNENA